MGSETSAENCVVSLNGCVGVSLKPPSHLKILEDWTAKQFNQAMILGLAKWHFVMFFVNVVKTRKKE